MSPKTKEGMAKERIGGNTKQQWMQASSLDASGNRSMMS
jgi:hypothetical protein